MSQFLVVIVSLFLNTGISAKSKSSGQVIMKKVYNQSRKHKTQKTICLMKITDKKGSTRIRHFKVLTKHKNKLKMSLIKFFKPKTVSGTGLLSHNNEDKKQTLQWLYLPAFRAIRRLQSSEKESSFMGSDFTYSDVGGRRLDQDRHILRSQDKTRYIIDSFPKDKSEKYKKMTFSIHKKTLVPISIKFYGKNMKHLKTLTNKKVKKIQGVYMATKTLMKNHITKGSTLIDISDIEVGFDLSDFQVGIKGLREG